jgi:hypothetical protein
MDSPLDPSQGLPVLNYLWTLFQPVLGYVIGAGLFIAAMRAIRAFMYGKE